MFSYHDSKDEPALPSLKPARAPSLALLPAQLYATVMTIGLLLSTLFTLTALTAHAENAFFPLYDGLLNDYVRETNIGSITSSTVDYRRWQQDPRHKQAMAALKAQDPYQFLNREEMISFWINAYNLLTVDLILSQGVTTSIRDIGGAAGNPWRKFSWEIGGKNMTLHAITELLNRENDPRIYFTLSCGALSCPDLYHRAYSSSNLYSTMDRQTRHFLENPAKGMMLMNHTEDGREQIKVSGIFKQYAPQIGGLENFIRKHSALEKPLIMGYLLYNWNLNAQPGREPQ